MLAIRKNEDKKLELELGGCVERESSAQTHLDPDRAKDKTITESISAKSLGDTMRCVIGPFEITARIHLRGGKRKGESRGKAANPHPPPADRKSWGKALKLNARVASIHLQIQFENIILKLEKTSDIREKQQLRSSPNYIVFPDPNVKFSGEKLQSSNRAISNDAL